MGTTARIGYETIERIARVCHEVNRAYCESLGDTSQQPWEAAPKWAKDSAIVGVTGIVEGRINTPGDSHRSWLAQKVEDGWQWGPIKHPEQKLHPCMVEFQNLPKDQQVKDFLFLGTAKALLKDERMTLIREAAGA